MEKEKVKELGKQEREIFVWLGNELHRTVLLPNKRKVRDIFNRLGHVVISPKNYVKSGYTITVDGYIKDKPRQDGYCKLYISYYYIYYNKAGEQCAIRSFPYGDKYGSFVGIYMAIYNFSNHFFRRYRERFLKDPRIPIKDVIETFMNNNKSFSLVDSAKKFPKNYDGEVVHKGIPYVVIKIPDGICFSYVTRDIENGTLVFDVTTFITNEMLKGGQKFLDEIDYNQVNL